MSATRPAAEAPSENLDTIVEHSPAMIWRSGPDASCDYFNSTWLRFTGRRLEDELGTGWTDGIHPEDREKRLAVHRRHGEERAPFEVEYRLRRHDGKYRRVLDRAAPYRDSGEFRGFVGVCLDLEDRIDGERAREGFLRSLAHELRTPLQAVRMLVEVVRRSAEAGEAPDPSLGRRIDGQFDRLGELIERIAEAEAPRDRRIRPEPLDVAVLLRRLAEGRNDLLRVPTARTLHVLRYRGPDHAQVVGDRGRLAQAFGSLLDNAVKFSPRGGLVELRLELEPEEICVQVRDQGIGIPADEIPLVARRFFRGSNAPRESFPGPGLGLAIARDIVERHGGSLEIESEVDHGTCVTARLPAGDGVH
jgi:PAS domain S-box-containing protein